MYKMFFLTALAAVSFAANGIDAAQDDEGKDKVLYASVEENPDEDCPIKADDEGKDKIS